MSRSSFSHGFNMISDPEMIDFTDVDSRFWTKANLNDSIADFYPSGECQFDDNTGVVSELIFFSEGLTLDIELFEFPLNSEDTEPTNKLGGQYVWAKHAVPAMRAGTGKAVGTNVLAYISKYQFLDDMGSSSYNMTIGATATEIARSEFGISVKDQKITMAGTLPDRYYRSNQTLSSFLRHLTLYAYSSRGKNSETPFYTFINAKGEFYFMSLNDLFEQKVSANIRLVAGNEEGFGKDKASFAQILFEGYDNTLGDYNIEQFHFAGDDFESEEHELKDSIVRVTPRSKFTVDKDAIGTEPTSFAYFGLASPLDEDNVKGYGNSYYIDSCLSYRLDLTMQFNSEVVAGHIVDLEIDSTLSDGISPEYSGKYLVIESHHAIGNNGTAYTNCVVAKPSVELRTDHILKNRYL